MSKNEPLPCPFCNCEMLDENEWIIDDEEVEAWECRRCKAGAPKNVWNNRGNLSWQDEITLGGGDDSFGIDSLNPI